jgi:hypothetical protein
MTQQIPFEDDNKKATARAKAKCGDLSTARQTMKLSAASVEMTGVLVG